MIADKKYLIILDSKNTSADFRCSAANVNYGYERITFSFDESGNMEMLNSKNSVGNNYSFKYRDEEIEKISSFAKDNNVVGIFIPNSIYMDDLEDTLEKISNLEVKIPVIVSGVYGRPYANKSLNEYALSSRYFEHSNDDFSFDKRIDILIPNGSIDYSAIDKAVNKLISLSSKKGI